MRRHNESFAARTRGKRSPERETRNVDPQDVPTLPEEWTHQQFLHDLRKVTGHKDESTPTD